MRRINLGVRGLVRGVGGVTLALLALAAVGCDTVAEISFPQRDFTSAATPGVIDSVSCNGTDTAVFFRFAVFDGDGELIAPGEQLNDVVISVDGSNPNFTNQDIEFIESVLYPTPDVPCSGDGDCTAPFTCQPINPFNPGASSQVCGMDVVVEVLQTPLTFDDGISDLKTIGLLMDYSDSLGGVDTNGGFAPECSTDRRDERISAARTFVLGYSRSSFGEDSEMCVVSFGGEDVGGVFFDPTPDNCLTGLARTADREAIDSRISGLGLGETGDSPVWSAVVETVAQQLAGAPGDRIIVIFTDGPDDGSVVADFTAALNAVLSEEVTVHIIHLDNEPTAAECSRRPSGPAVQDQYAQLACASGGSYQYATGPEDLRTMFDNLAGTIGARYQVEAQVIALASLAPGTYRLATGVRISLAGTQRTIQLAGDKTDPATLKIIDDRLTLFVRPVPTGNGTDTNGESDGPR